MRRLLILMMLLPGWVAAQDGEPAIADESAEVSAEASADMPETPSDAAAEPQTQGDKTMLGMSILGNEEAPKSLVIVPWKSSRIGDGLGVRNSMDGRPGPVDREVFMREVHYYELRSGGTD